ncbi:MAG: hypothetical protein HYZ83_01405 [Candidatus Omnitrophica bacterium]|nr:hypothetical protein [Candidatus Omnitrophota bacterium]
MLKKIMIITFFILMGFVPFCLAGVDGHTEKGVWAREATVIGRGLGNIIGLPLEIPRAFQRETGTHSRVWPITFIPRLLTNLAVRLSSIFNDLVVYPWVAPFTDDLSPWTESYDIPEYPWQGN